MKDRLTVLRQIQAAAPHHLAQAASQWLQEDGIESVDAQPGEIDVAYAAGLWRIRVRHVRQAGKQLVGADEFFATLTTMNPEKKLVQYSFDSAEHTGSVFFEKTNRKYVGLLIVEATTESIPLDADLLAETRIV